MTRKTLFCLAALWLLLSCGREDEHDMEKPVIDMSGAGSYPEPCSIVYKGESFPFKAVFSDNVELGNYNIEIHNNFDHHSHSTDNAECEPDEKKTASPKVFKYNQDFEIPLGSTIYETQIDIPVPADADEGDYHFMIRLTDREGWQQLKAISIKIRERE